MLIMINLVYRLSRSIVSSYVDLNKLGPSVQIAQVVELKTGDLKDAGSIPGLGKKKLTNITVIRLITHRENFFLTFNKR